MDISREYIILSLKWVNLLNYIEKNKIKFYFYEFKGERYD